MSRLVAAVIVIIVVLTVSTVELYKNTVELKAENARLTTVIVDNQTSCGK